MEFSKVLEELKRSNLSFRDELDSEKFYERLHKLSNFRGYFNDCSSLGNLPSGTNIIKICAKVLKYLETIHKEIYKKDNPYDVCLLLNFWVYSRLFDTLQDENNVYIAYAQLQSIWNYFNDNKLKKTGNQLCRPYFNIVLQDNWRYIKELYEYYVDYSPIYKSLPFFQDRCKEFYHYVESKKSLYEHFKKFCYPYKKNGCPELYTKYEEYHPDKVLSTFLCHQKIIDERAAAALEDPQKEDTFPAGETDSEAQSDDTLPLSTQSLPQKSHTVENVGNILFGVVATSMTSGALYRFTPLGNMIRNGLGWNSNNMRNFNGGDFRLYDYASEPFIPYTGSGEEHIIGYQPA
ncbi:Plasmodium vivax Vir protein, putative [Plasmodium vivax]|uniref:Vir protein, putative n=1 Tax=Plasmodium vivax TaxID=5855 RepID=A0A1G4E420_PLAVI|nr:Plasmodium vivax Vir protein, putative [Plasmodium vivax]